MTSPTFTAVICAFNAASTLRDAIRSVLAQTRDDLELIVVDDGSTDATPTVARSFESDPRMILVQQENRGLAAARNTGLARARGRYVGFNDADDLWMPTYLEELGRAMEADPAAAIATGDLWMLDESTRRMHRRTAFDIYPSAPARIAGEELVGKLVAGNFLPGCSMVRPEAIAKAGGFDASRSAVEDWDMWIRVAALGYAAIRIRRPLVIWRDRSGSMSKDRLLMTRNRREVLLNVIERYDVPKAARIAAHQRLPVIERDIRALGGERSLASVAGRIRWRLITAKRRLRNRLDLLRAPPPEVAEAFPELASPRSRLFEAEARGPQPLGDSSAR
jgi:GT2 family glycosyltransferase